MSRIPADRSVLNSTWVFIVMSGWGAARASTGQTEFYNEICGTDGGLWSALILLGSVEWISRLNDGCNYTRIANFRLGYSQLGYLGVLFVRMPVIG